MTKSGKSGGGSKMSPTAASRIQSATTKSGGDTGKGSFAARAQSAAANSGKGK